MSQYLQFLLEHVGAREPAAIVIRRESEEWINHQLLDEFVSAFPNATVLLSENPGDERADLFVLPYSWVFDSRDRKAWAGYQRLSAATGAWVMLYGLEYRRILVLPSDRFFRHVLISSIFTWLAEWDRIPAAVARRLAKMLRR